MRPFKAKLVSARFLAASVTCTVPVDLRNCSVSLLASTPDASTSVTALTLTETEVEANDVINVTGTTGSGEVVDGSLTLEWRPYLGSQERVSAGFGDF